MQRGTARQATVVFVTANQTLPHDRRVWQECRSIQRRGFRVIGLSPKTGATGRTEQLYERVDDIPIYRYPLELSTGGFAAYGREFGAAVYGTARILHRLARTTRIDVVHAANPPDFLLLAAFGLKRRGTRLIFDHHDLSPELYLSRSGRRDPVYFALRALERLTFRTADIVISTNDSFRRIAMERGGRRPEDVFVVRNGPDLSTFRPMEPDPKLTRGKRHLLAYAGVMGPQDGIDLAIRSLAALKRRRQDWHAIMMGNGDVLPEIKRLTTRLDLHDAVEFTGWVPNDVVLRVLSSADVCLAPDPDTPANTQSTMIKIMEYMALGRPIVSFDLVESRVSAGESARFVTGDDVDAFAAQIDELLDDPQARAAMGHAGRQRVERDLAWKHSERALHNAYDRLFSV